jgi:hypothetical protein
MGLDAALLAGDGKENLGNAMTNVVSHNIFDEEHRQPNADDGINEIEPVGTGLNELVRQQVLNLPDEPFQEQTRTSREDADKEADEQHEPALREVSAAPTDKPCYGVTIIQN